MDSPTSLDLSPWVLLCGEGAEQTLCLWRIKELNSDAIALFSTKELATTYADEFVTGGSVCSRQLSSVELARVLLDAYKAGLLHAVLDPLQETARQVFDLKEVLRAARSQLREK